MSLLRNAGWNFAGAVLPALVLFITIPLIVQRLGAPTFGLLALVTSIVGYFALLDVNASPGVVKFLAAHHARGEHDALARVAGLGLLLQAAVGLAGAALLAGLAVPLATRVFDVPAAQQAEAVAALRWAALGFAVTQLQQGVQCLPQALQRYDLTGRLDAAFGALVPVATLLVVLGGGSLVPIVATRTALALLHLGLLLHAVRQLLPGWRPAWPTVQASREVLHFSAWAWLQKLAAVLHAHADKLMVGAQRSLLDLAGWVIASTLVQRLAGPLFRLSQALLPRASALAAQQRLHDLAAQGVAAQRYNLWLHAALVLVLAVFAPEWLHHWLGPTLPPEAPLVLVLVALTTWCDAVTQVPSLVNDGLGHPQHTGLAALLRAGVGVAAGWWALRQGGVLGLAWSQLVVAALVAALFLAWVQPRTLPWPGRQTLGRVFGPALLLLVLAVGLVLGRQGQPVWALPHFLLGLAAALLLLALWGWWGVLDATHRQRLQALLRRGPAEGPSP